LIWGGGGGVAGGDQSIFCRKLFSTEIDLVFRQAMPLATFYYDPTIGPFGGDLESRTNAQDGYIGSNSISRIASAFLCIHGAGNVLLPRSGPPFREHYPFYGLQSLGLDGTSHSYKTSKKGHEYLRLNSLLQPMTLFCLGGYCLVEPSPTKRPFSTQRAGGFVFGGAWWPLLVPILHSHGILQTDFLCAQKWCFT